MLCPHDLFRRALASKWSFSNINYNLYSYLCINHILTLNKYIMAIEITDANFEELVINSDKPVMLDFWAIWCGPCRMITPIVEEMEKEYDGKALIGSVDVDSNPDVAMKFGIRNIPTMLFIKDGKIADKQVGAGPKKLFSSKLDALL